MNYSIVSEADSAQVKEEVEVALHAKQELARSFRSTVGYAIRTYDGELFWGANIETYGQKSSMHAEEMAVYAALMRGYNGTDMKRITGVFTDAGIKSNQPITPPCLYCQGVLLEFAHPYLQIVKADTNGNVVAEMRLADLYKGNPLATIFPTINSRLGKPRSNMRAKLPLNSELEVYYVSDSAFRTEVNDIFQVKKLPGSASMLYDKVSKAWSAETSADPIRWSNDNPAWGQCAITATVVYDHLGGKILRVEVEDVENVSSHYYNQLPDGRIIDFTRQQFDSNAVFKNIQERTKEYIISYQKTKERYELLLRRMEQ